jgi:Fe-S cluster biogenesis protein NfuA
MSKSENTCDAIQSFIEETLGAAIREDGGNIAVEGFENDTIRVKMTDACATCPAWQRSVRHFVEPEVRRRFGEKWSVEARIEKPYYKRG